MLANSSAQDQVNHARSQAIQNELAQQSALQGQANSANTADIGTYNDIAGQRAADTTRFGNLISAASATPSSGLPAVSLPKASSPLVAGDEQKQLANANAYATQQGQALVNLRSFGDVMGERQRGTAENAQNLAQIASFMKGDASVLPYQLDAANQAGNGLKTFADILKGGGSLATGYGLQGSYNPLGSTIPGGAATTTALPGTMAVGSALDRASVPNYAGSVRLSSLY